MVGSRERLEWSPEKTSSAIGQRPDAMEHAYWPLRVRETDPAGGRATANVLLGQVSPWLAGSEGGGVVLLPGGEMDRFLRKWPSLPRQLTGFRNRSSRTP